MAGVEKTLFLTRTHSMINAKLHMCPEFSTSCNFPQFQCEGHGQTYSTELLDYYSNLTYFLTLMFKIALLQLPLFHSINLQQNCPSVSSLNNFPTCYIVFIYLLWTALLILIKEDYNDLFKKHLVKGVLRECVRHIEAAEWLNDRS